VFIIEKSLVIHEMLEKEYQERETSEDESSEEEAEEREWDCQSILSTYTNTDNHPAVIKTAGRVVKTKQRMELHKQFKVPLDGLMAEEITVVKPKKIPVLVEADDSSDDADEAVKDDSKASRKKQMKQEKREKRKLKKELKIAFQSQNSKLVKQTTADLGALRAGVSVKKIY